MHKDKHHNYIIQDWIYSLTFLMWKMLHKCFVRNQDSVYADWIVEKRKNLSEVGNIM